MNGIRIGALNLRAQGLLLLISETPFLFCPHARILDCYLARPGNFLKGVKNISCTQSTSGPRTQRRHA